MHTISTTRVITAVYEVKHTVRSNNHIMKCINLAYRNLFMSQCNFFYTKFKQEVGIAIKSNETST